jgi:hypothetical protein
MQLVPLVMLAAACAWQGTPVPVSGDLSALSGSWSGTYSSEESGRSGSITFQLIAGTDSAFGDVVMSPDLPQDIRTRDAPQMVGVRRPMAEPLRIAFVRCTDDEVSGALAVYHDPLTETHLYTVFRGKLHGKEFRGTYTTRSEAGGREIQGVWSVRRAP